ncbi:bifunctional ADP-dependent NAD(P)H-hydrate dehydratase/NAD(P)H-hydrate epimerase [Helicobacter pametensis]|uniref:bifunctional ADP-dependent NAD(P)H-hydrate dehydratase/NAD(P)H-hydrate epimerase n=1 Tax=Helicobacter pametensis TaxID=95149 RepID=UPI0004843584|nr:bifunctional ADP-dependent NAD(P)H-hydrate dehydratase/NAD(P)H-hydrate epimerase [Helicobacter pametensis]
MQNIYKETRLLDKRAIDKFLLSEEILVENASVGLKHLISQLVHKKSLIYIVCGGGNNGADGLALARKLDGDYVIKVYMADEPKTSLCQREFMRAKAMGIDFVNKLYACDVVVDCLYGSGFRGELCVEMSRLIEAMNKMAKLRIACDLPSGIAQRDLKVAFKAHHTVAMGALKLDLFGERAKDYVGKISVADLGISRKQYETSSKIKLLERSDLCLPHRSRLDTHKGEYGHLAVLCKNHPSSKQGAGVLSALGGLAFGAGLVSLIGEIQNPPYSVMCDTKIPQDACAIAFGMGAGEVEKADLEQCKRLPCVLDADVFGYEGLSSELAEMRHVVLTPHIKEFANLLRLCGIADMEVTDVKIDRVILVEEFCMRYPELVLVLKGANTIIAKDKQIYICPFGSNNLAKGGSGDVLSGMIAALLAQGYQPMEAAINGVLAHALASEKIPTSYGLNPQDLIEAIKFL